jgi:hypothetical protein
MNGGGFQGGGIQDGIGVTKIAGPFFREKFRTQYRFFNPDKTAMGGQGQPGKGSGVAGVEGTKSEKTPEKDKITASI